MTYEQATQHDIAFLRDDLAAVALKLAAAEDAFRTGAHEVTALRKDIRAFSGNIDGLKGTITSFASKREVAEDIQARMKTVEETLQADREADAKRLARQWWGRVLMVVAVLVLVGLALFVGGNQRQQIIEESVITACEHRQVLESTLRSILLDSAERASTPEAGERLRMFAERLESPPCRTLLEPNGR